MAKPNLRPDHNGTQRAQFNSNKKKIFATQKVCGICGKPVDFRIKFPEPLSPCIDHMERPSASWDSVPRPALSRQKRSHHTVSD